MVTDWLHNPDVLRLLPLVVALVLASILAATRRVMPPQQPRWRLARALIIVAVLTASTGLQVVLLGTSAAALYGPPVGAMGTPQAWLTFAAAVVGALLVGWLIPSAIEGRSLWEMGWTRRKAARYFVGGAAAAILLAAVPRVQALPPELQEAYEANPSSALGALVMTPGAAVGLLIIGFARAGWIEENIFRGHLLPALREVGLSGRAANVAQAALFMAMHLPNLLLRTSARIEQGAGAIAGTAVFLMLSWFLWGLLFGWLRMRFRSIVPGFALHGTYDFALFARHWAPTLALMQSLSP